MIRFCFCLYCERNSLIFNSFKAVAVTISKSSQQIQSESFSDFVSIMYGIHFNFLRFWGVGHTIKLFPKYCNLSI